MARNHSNCTFIHFASYLWLLLVGVPTVVREGWLGSPFHNSTKTTQWMRGNSHMEIRVVLPKERFVTAAVYHGEVQA